jgi:hypothetical protein
MDSGCAAQVDNPVAPVLTETIFSACCISDEWIADAARKQTFLSAATDGRRALLIDAI